MKSGAVVLAVLGAGNVFERHVSCSLPSIPSARRPLLPSAQQSPQPPHLKTTRLIRVLFLHPSNYPREHLRSHLLAPSHAHTQEPSSFSLSVHLDHPSVCLIINALEGGSLSPSVAIVS